MSHPARKNVIFAKSYNNFYIRAVKSTVLVNLYSRTGIKASEADYEAATASVGLLTRQESPSALNRLLSAHHWLNVDLRTARYWIQNISRCLITRLSALDSLPAEGSIQWKEWPFALTGCKLYLRRCEKSSQGPGPSAQRAGD